ncbi:704_t:CDS:2 [Paraglomus occultum]|uniref:704_t:CDS:1 n=1 Tax=Paraglomus occultum TaxID=144539 RepID=A0A9N9F9F1_9GLOM|nr:704_t:CDS:2 [Paraglomus occultum]
MVHTVTACLCLCNIPLSIGLLIWKLHNKPGSRLFTVNGFLAMEGFLFTQIFFNASRVAISVILLYNLLDSQWIARSMMDYISWYLGSVAVATYLAGVLRTIPRMHFYRQSPSHKLSLHLPTIRAVMVAYVIFVVAALVFNIVTASLTGYFLTEKQNLESSSSGQSNVDKYLSILYAIQYGACGIFVLLIAIAYIIYGNKLTEIASEGSYLLKAMSRASGADKKKKGWTFSEFGPRGKELEAKHRTLKLSVLKMKFLHIIFVISLLLLGSLLISFACFHERIINNLSVSKIYASGGIMTVFILNTMVLVVIACGCFNAKIKPKQDVVTDVITTDLTSPAPASQSHIRNGSAGSESQLLRSPPPIVTSPLGRSSVTWTESSDHDIVNIEDISKDC